MAPEILSPEKLPYGTKTPYLTIFGSHDYRVMNLRKLSKTLIEEYCCNKPLITSGRLGTGIAGMTRCIPGNEGPKDTNEVIIFIGVPGLIESVKLGFLPCPTCKPNENIMNYWEMLSSTIQETYAHLLTDPKQYLDRSVLNFDAMQVNLGKILQYTKKLPGRLYIPPNLSSEEVLKRREYLFSLIDSDGPFPDLGYFDWNAGKETGFFVPYPVLSL